MCGLATSGRSVTFSMPDSWAVRSWMACVRQSHMRSGSLVLARSLYSWGFVHVHLLEPPECAPPRSLRSRARACAPRLNRSRPAPYLELQSEVARVRLCPILDHRVARFVVSLVSSHSCIVDAVAHVLGSDVGSPLLARRKKVASSSPSWLPRHVVTSVCERVCGSAESRPGVRCHEPPCRLASIPAITHCKPLVHAPSRHNRHMANVHCSVVTWSRLVVSWRVDRH